MVIWLRLLSHIRCLNWFTQVEIDVHYIVERGLTLKLFNWFEIKSLFSSIFDDLFVVGFLIYFFWGLPGYEFGFINQFLIFCQFHSILYFAIFEFRKASHDYGQDQIDHKVRAKCYNDHKETWSKEDLAWVNQFLELDRPAFEC